MANQSGYTDSELMRMQADAMRRVKEMQRRSQSYAGRQATPAAQPHTHQNQQPAQAGGRLQFQPKQPSSGPHQGTQHPGQDRARQQGQNNRRTGQPERHGGQSGPHEPRREPEKEPDGVLNPGRAISRLLSGIQFDSDTIIILGLAWLLFKNGGSYKLILALLYILL